MAARQVGVALVIATTLGGCKPGPTGGQHPITVPSYGTQLAIVGVVAATIALLALAASASDAPPTDPGPPAN